LDPVRDLNPMDIQDASHAAGRSELGLDDLHTLAGAGPITSANFISVFNPMKGPAITKCFYGKGPAIRLLIYRLMPLIFLALDRLSGLTFFKIFVTGDVLIVLARLNDA